MVKEQLKEKTTHLLFKELLRSIKGNIKQFFSVIAISFLAVCLFSGLTSNAYNLRERADALYQASNYADLYVTTTGLESGDFEAVKGAKGVSVAEKRATLSCTREKRAVSLLSAPTTNTLSVPMMVSGTSGFVVCDSYLEANLLNLGDSIELEMTNYLLTTPSIAFMLPFLTSYVQTGKSNVLADNTIKLEFEITGTMLHPEAVKTSKYVSSTVMYSDPDLISASLYKVVSDNYDMTKLDAALVSQKKGDTKSFIYSFINGSANQVLANSSDKEASLNAINEYFTSKSTNNLVIALKKESLPSYQGLETDIEQALKLTFVFPVIFFLVSLLVILTTISQIIIRERMQIGSLKAIGVPRSQIYLHYVSYGFFLTLIGTVLGYFIGPLFIPDVMNIKYKLLWDVPAKRASFFYPAYFPSSLLSVWMAVGLLLISLLASFLVCFSVIREKPVDTLRVKAPKLKQRKGETKPLLAPFKAISSKTLTFKMAFRNMSRNKLKTVMVILGTLGCTALLVCGFGIMDTLDNCLDNDFRHLMIRDITAVPNHPSESLAIKLKGIDGVERLEEITQYPVSLAAKSSADSNLILLEDTSLCLHIPYGVDGGVTLDKTTAENIGAKLNDELTVVINGNKYTAKVTYIFTSSSLRGVYAKNSQFTQAGLKPNNYWITCSKDPLSVKTYIQDNYGPESQVGEFTSTNSLLTQDEYFAYIDELLSSVRIMTRVVEIFAILLSAVVIYNLTSLNISERTRDIATMKVLGFRYHEIAKTLITEIMFDTIIGTFIGLFFGLPMCILVMTVNKNEFITYLYNVKWTTYLLSVFVSLGTAFVVNVLLSRRTKKIKMVESLKSVE
ncbi:MAG: ABC transporter permease [Bacilli bacterium]|jgi:putative ABC transport system permease protein|nr:ABC transporter permease [Bacilli bacterium]